MERGGEGGGAVAEVEAGRRGAGGASSVLVMSAQDVREVRIMAAAGGRICASIGWDDARERWSFQRRIRPRRRR